MISSSMPCVAGTLKEVYKLLAILSVLLVITYILNYDRGGYVIFLIKRSTTFTDDVLCNRSRSRCNMFVYYGVY